MNRYLTFSIKTDELAVALSDRLPAIDIQNLTAIRNPDTISSFKLLWGIIEERCKVWSKVYDEQEAAGTMPFKAYIQGAEDYIIEYDSNKINKLIPMFSLIKAWLEFNGCNGFILRDLY